MCRVGCARELVPNIRNGAAQTVHGNTRMRHLAAEEAQNLAGADDSRRHLRTRIPGAHHGTRAQKVRRPRGATMTEFVFSVFFGGEPVLVGRFSSFFQAPLAND